MNQAYEQVKSTQQVERVKAEIAKGTELMILLKNPSVCIKNLNIAKDDYRIHISFSVSRIGVLTNMPGNSEFIAALETMDENKSKLMSYLDKLSVFPPICIEDLKMFPVDNSSAVSFSIPIDKIGRLGRDIRTVLGALLYWVLETPAIDI